MSPRLFCTMACQHASTIHRICNFQTWLLSSGQQRKLEVTHFRAHCDAVVLIIQRAGCKLPGSAWAPCFSPKTTAEYNGSKRHLAKAAKDGIRVPGCPSCFPTDTIRRRHCQVTPPDGPPSPGPPQLPADRGPPARGAGSSAPHQSGG